MKKRLLLMSIGLLFSLGLFAQDGNTGGPSFHTEWVAKCHDDGAGVLTSFYELQIFRVGDANPIVVETYDASNTAYTVPTTGTVSLGYCAGASAGAEYDYEIFAVQKCDDTGTGLVSYLEVTLLYYDVNVPNSGTPVLVNVSQYDAAGAAYTTVGTVSTGACDDQWTVKATTRVRRSYTNAGSLTTNFFSSICIENVGFATGSLTVGSGTPEPLLPGETYFCNESYDFESKTMRSCSNVAWDATGTEFRITRTNRN